MKKKKWIILSAFIILPLVAEIATRLTGIADFPTYEVSADLGYALHPNQQGKFLNKNDWQFNQKQQGAEEWQAGGKNDILLLGDSIVLGGNALGMSERLGACLEAKISGSQVWPASAGSWSVANEVGYLNKYPEVAKDAEQLIWVLNTGDLEPGSIWKTDLTHPRSRPASALIYAINKYVLPKLFKKNTSAEEPPTTPDITTAVVQKLSETITVLRNQSPSLQITFVLYPSQDEYSLKNQQNTFYLQFKNTLQSVINKQYKIIEVRDDPRWNLDLYRDPIHQTAKGNQVLAEILAEALTAN